MRPKNYREWRKLYHDQCFELGMWIADKRFPVQWTRGMYQCFNRIKRIKMHMDAEAEAYTDSWCRCLLEAMKGWE